MELRNLEPFLTRLCDRPGLMTTARFCPFKKSLCNHNCLIFSCFFSRESSGSIGGAPMTTSLSRNRPAAMEAMEEVTCVGFWFSGRNTAKSRLFRIPARRCGPGRWEECLLVVGGGLSLIRRRIIGWLDTFCASSSTSNATCIRGTWRPTL